MELKDFVQVVGAWSNGDGPLYRRLTVALIKAIVEGAIATGTQLPSERTLAEALAISRSTVVAAYNLLQQEEWVESRQGTKTKVRPYLDGKVDLLRHNNGSSLARSPFFNTLFEEAQPNIDFSGGTPGNLTDLPPSAFVLTETEISDLLKERGYSALGLPVLRRTIANYYNDVGLPTSESQILVTTGAQQAISLVATCYLQRGDTVIIDNPTYFGAIDALRAAGARLIGIRVEQNGIRPEILRAQLETTLPRLIYLQPTFQNPTGTVLSVQRRREIAELAQEFNIPVIEDNTLAEIVLEQTASPLPIAAYSHDATIITIGSMSKLFWAGLRVGWIRASESVVNRLGRIKVVNDLGSSVINQAIANSLLCQVSHVKTLRRTELAAKLELVSSLLSEELPSWKWERPAGGIFLWIKLPQGDAGAFAQIALRFGVTIVPGSIMSVDETYFDYLRLPFLLDSNSLTEGIKRLAAAWKAYQALSENRQPQVQIIV